MRAVAQGFTCKGGGLVLGTRGRFWRGPPEGRERGGTSSMSSCISTLSDSDRVDFDLTSPRGIPPLVLEKKGFPVWDPGPGTMVVVGWVCGGRCLPRPR